MLGIRWGGVDHIPRVQLDAGITADSSPDAVRAALQKQCGGSCLPVGEPTSMCTSHTQPAVVVDASGNMVPYLGGFPLVYALSSDACGGEAGELSTTRLEEFFEAMARAYCPAFGVEPCGTTVETCGKLNEMLSFSAWAASSNKPSNTAPVVIRCHSDVDIPDGLRWLTTPNVGRFWAMRLLQPTRSMTVAEFMAAVDSVCTASPRLKADCLPDPLLLESTTKMPKDALRERRAFAHVLALATKALVVEHRLCDALRTLALFAAMDGAPHEFVKWWREECPVSAAGTVARAFTVLQTRYLFAFDGLPAAMERWDVVKAAIHRHHGNRFGKLPNPDVLGLEELWEQGKVECAYRADGCGCDTLAPVCAAQHHTATDAGKLVPGESSEAST